ncbi:uracil-DNA glycosylase [Paracraurococcus ruber]|uniref:Type-5 uracil-DNA glycosylase n=1 Tax=Paracraurococcus ruber TaxID=77675 RepID=A0ABS1D1S3_9PROT|nr:uracil-DNA glycosylase [Paracraurococcus ruber]MBK1660511.1 uracil-DNA glycosylase [Paracraurococcus ruber]TDG29365.1 uracil-DNA glycosylase [Paracraurococcus ruber]
MTLPAEPAQPPPDCPLCPRLAALRQANRAAFPDWHNAPVPSWGPRDARILVLGMAPGQRGANRTGRPFTGDHAGRLLYATLLRFGLAEGTYEERPDDGLVLTGCRVTNAVRCVPPANLPEPAEIRACNGFLAGELAAMPNLRVVLALGVLAHNALLRVFGVPAARLKFAHGALHDLPGGLRLADSYHVSRYNTSTRKLTTEMFEAVVSDLVGLASREPGGT